MVLNHSFIGNYYMWHVACGIGNYYMWHVLSGMFLVALHWGLNTIQFNEHCHNAVDLLIINIDF